MTGLAGWAKRQMAFGVRRAFEKISPKDGAPVKWRVPVGWGYGGASVVGDSVFSWRLSAEQGNSDEQSGKAVTWEGKERLLCLDAKTGKAEVGLRSGDRKYELSYPGGPRATPTVVDGKVYFLGAMGHLACVDAKSGKLIWEKDFQKDFGAPLPIWGFRRILWLRMARFIVWPEVMGVLRLRWMPRRVR